VQHKNYLRAWRITDGASTQRRCELLNDAAEAAINNLFFRGWSRKPTGEQRR